MSNKQNYQTLVTDYESSTQIVKKLGLSGGMMQFSVIMIVSSLKPLEIPYYKLIGPLILLWAIYSFAKDFLIFLRVEKRVVQIIVDGISLEKRNTNCGSYFREVLGGFNLIKILLIRSLINLATLGCFGYFLSRCIADLNPSLAISHRLLVLISGMLTALASKFYYEALKPLEEAKEQAFAAKS